MTRNLLVTTLVAVLMAGFVLAYLALTPAQDRPAMDGMAPTSRTGKMGDMDMTVPRVPPVKGFAAGEEIHFIHTEASDPEIAQVLTDMMGSPVLVVPALAQTPEATRANVYVFTNGIQGDGPLRFQPDVFDYPPRTDGYRPLRTVNLVTWQNEQAAHVLKSAAEVQEAQNKGEVTIEQPGVVVNMPFLTWPGGQR